jgi:uncharacterized protein YndB with AHSA1/START domain
MAGPVPQALDRGASTLSRSIWRRTHDRRRYEQVNGRPALRFTRRLPHSVDRVWRAATSYDDLAAWFATPVEFTHAGQHFEAMEERGEVLRYEPPRLLEFAWGDERLSFDLEPELRAARTGGTRSGRGTR